MPDDHDRLRALAELVPLLDAADADFAVDRRPAAAPVAAADPGALS